MDSATIGAVAAGILKSEGSRNVIKRLLQRLWTHITVKAVYAVVVNDVDRKTLKFGYDDAKFQLLDVEKVYLSLLGNGELKRLSNLKLFNRRGWIMAVRKPMKSILDTVAKHWKKERVICVLSSIELAHELGITSKHMRCFVPDSELQTTMKDSLQPEWHDYFDDTITHYQKFSSTDDYKSSAKLVERIEAYIRSLP